MIKDYIHSKMITQKVVDEDTREIIQLERVSNATIPLEDIHSLVDATGIFLFDSGKPVVGVTYFTLAGTLYYQDDYRRILKAYEDYKLDIDRNMLQSKFN